MFNFIFNESTLCLVQEENIVQNCTDIAMPVCAVDQVVKMELTPNGCKRFICGMYILYCNNFIDFIAINVYYANRY